MKQILSILLIAILFACVKEPEYAESEIEAVKQAMKNDFLSKTVRKPGGQPFKIGKVGGTINLVTSGEPKSFNIIASGDSSAQNILEPLHDYLVNYDPYKKEFTPQAACKFEIETPESGGMIVRYYLRDNMYWTTSDGKVRVPVTADDPIFWYDEIHGDAALRTSGYAAQFVTMDDGSEKRITIHKVDRLTFEFHLPKVDANPLLSTNMNFGPKYIYEKAKKERGIEGVLNVLSIDTDLKTLPSMGPMHIVEYTPGVRIVMKRNPNYWKKDENGVVLPYYETAIYKVVGDLNAENLLFKSGQVDYINVRHENLEEYINRDEKNYTVYDGGTSLGSDYITFNQNPEKLEEKKHKWFSSTQFRQAMSCLVNRERIIRQVYRGLGEPAHDFFCKANPMYNEKIKLEYTYDPAHALRLLNKAGFDFGTDKKMRDRDGNPVEF
ncbi:MAG: ABC transporter substrate-binding protein, partial [Spirochaetales bacterium]|nr:ABC transporter substrate-binding protein [Spirochaetales bacterium]